MLRYLLPVLACAVPLAAASAPRPVNRHVQPVTHHAPVSQGHAPRPVHAPRPIQAPRTVYRHVQQSVCPPAYRPVARACPPAPCPTSVWIEGSWQWSGCEWVWQTGYWTQQVVAAPACPPRRRGTSISVSWRW